MGKQYDSNIHHRRSLRLPGYDYSQPGAYFVTLCAQHRECLFGVIQNHQIILSDLGTIVYQGWLSLPSRFDHITLDAAVTMPNHFHGILLIQSPQGRGAVSAPDHSTPTPKRPTLGQIVAYFKYQTTKLINQLRDTPSQPVWQRNYYEHIIRSDSALTRLRHYIHNNPGQWEIDQLHPQNPSG